MSKRKLTPLGVAVKKRLIDLRKTQVQLAEEIGTSKKYLDLILYGERSGKSYLPKIAIALDIDLDSLEEPA